MKIRNNIFIFIFICFDGAWKEKAAKFTWDVYWFSFSLFLPLMLLKWEAIMLIQMKHIMLL